MSHTSRLCFLPLLLLVLVVPSTLVTAATCTSTLPCVADCSGCTKYDKIPDPSNCRGYFLCKDASTYYPTPFQCEEGQEFDSQSHECITGDTCSPCPQVCEYECSGSSSSAAIPYTCGYYYECKSGSAGRLLKCDTLSPFFDGITCQSDESRCCHCRPYCYAGDVDTLIADPQDCRRYYACIATGTPAIFGDCPDGQNFDYDAQGCSPSKVCDTSLQCQNVVDADGCIDPFTCQSTGTFAKCPEQCTEEYYSCTAVTEVYQTVQTCGDGNVFHPYSHTCVKIEDCP